MTQIYHKPVLLQELIDSLEIKKNGVYVDLTFGGGGHSREILKRLGEAGKLIAFDNDEDAVSYNFSLSYTDKGFTPYVTYAESNSLSTNQVGGIDPLSVDDGSFVQDSELFETGIKYMDGIFYASLSYFDQEKTYRSDQTGALVAVFGDGVEFELRALITDNFSILATVSDSDTTCLLYTSPSPRDKRQSRMPSSA